MIKLDMNRTAINWVIASYLEGNSALKPVESFGIGHQSMAMFLKEPFLVLYLL